ncbi:rab11 family-interacting protein 4-like isoform X2 [Amphibalanus amphitrite]|uniref:rab11 family-interacting protein 4-like isoform X2 n=2 Tax=Amphibalanus amphitrite TaxID=1232801 RepID=UPI001C90DCB1|nr:rab11 family-interacting protein 4-like isoform X2 [Amphibalanus amphitrite]
MDRKRAWRMKEKLFQPTLKCFTKQIDEDSTRLTPLNNALPERLNNMPNLVESPRDESHVTDMDNDSAIGRSSTSPDPTFKVTAASPCNSSLDKEESFECLGEADSGTNSHLNRSRDLGLPDVDFSKRTTWLRTSLRRNPRNNASELPSHFRRYGSMKQSKRSSVTSGISSPVYRTPSFNSSGRSSNCDGEDMYSDISIEDDVNDLNQKVHVLERQVTVLAENQNNNDDRYTRSKEENAALQARLIMLEEQLREVELRSAEQLDAEKRRHKELIQRLEREKALELENQSIRLQSLEKEVRFAETEAARARQQLESVCAERASQEERLAQLTASLETARQESRSAVELERRGREQLEQERAAQSQMMSELSSELADTRQQASLRLKTESDEAGLMRLRQTELEAELRQLRQQNRELQESHDELQAQLLSSGLQEGRQLLESGPKSLALELEDLSGEQLKKSLLEQQEVNKQLRAYIDGILLNIVENHPQLLEVKQHP